MKFFVSTFPTIKRGCVDLDENQLKIVIPSSKSNEKEIKEIPLGNISAVDLKVEDNKSKAVTIGFILVQMMELLGLVIFVMNLSNIPMMILGGFILLVATIFAFIVVFNKRKCVLTVVQNDSKTEIEGAYVEREKFIKLHEALFDKLKMMAR